LIVLPVFGGSYKSSKIDDFGHFWTLAENAQKQRFYRFFETHKFYRRQHIVDVVNNTSRGTFFKKNRFFEFCKN